MDPLMVWSIVVRVSAIMLLISFCLAVKSVGATLSMVLWRFQWYREVVEYNQAADNIYRLQRGEKALTEGPWMEVKERRRPILIVNVVLVIMSFVISPVLSQIQRQAYDAYAREQFGMVVVATSSKSVVYQKGDSTLVTVPLLAEREELHVIRSNDPKDHWQPDFLTVTDLTEVGGDITITRNHIQL